MPENHEIPQENSSNSIEDFNKKKTHFFNTIALSVKEMIKLHKDFGMLEKDDEGKREWGNVTEHCLVEVARAQVLAEKLNLTEDIQKELRLAAAVHDANKKHEITSLKSQGSSIATLQKVSDEMEVLLQQKGVSDRVIHMAGSVGMTEKVYNDIKPILDKGVESLTEDEIAYLIMHYVDVYTVGDRFVEPAEKISGDMYKNDLDRRIDKNENNPNYTNLNEESRAYFDGKSLYQVQREVGYEVEEKLAQLLAVRAEETIDPKFLPEYIDTEIRKKIDEVVL